MEFKPFPKVPRLSRECVITEKIDGTNASIHIKSSFIYEAGLEMPGSTHPRPSAIVRREAGEEDLGIWAASRNRFITPERDNFGFAAWVGDNAEELANLGEGVHFGEWWGRGIQRGYGLTEKRFSLFNTKRWIDPSTQPGDPVYGDTFAPACCHVVPVLWQGMFDKVTYDYHENATTMVDKVLDDLGRDGSTASPGYKSPEGIMVYHTAANHLFKKTFDDGPKG